MKDVCHKATGTNVANSDRGVTANSVRVTTISDAGSSFQQGLNQELWDVAHVFAAWCNDNGGINGRKIVVTEGDAQLSLYKQTIDAACASQFALVGGGGAFDDQGQVDRVKCLLPAFDAFAASSDRPHLGAQLPRCTDARAVPEQGRLHGHQPALPRHDEAGRHHLRRDPLGQDGP